MTLKLRNRSPLSVQDSTRQEMHTIGALLVAGRRG